MMTSKRFRRLVLIFGFSVIFAFILFYDFSSRKDFHEKMSNIKIGMMTDSVLVMIGKPDTIIQTKTTYGNKSVWYYFAGYKESEAYKLVIDQKIDTVLYINEP